MTEEDRLLTTAEVAELLRIPLRTVVDWRHRDAGPEWVRIGRHVRYRRGAIEVWLDTRAVVRG